MSIRLLGITTLALGLALGCSGTRKSIKRADAYMADQSLKAKPASLCSVPGRLGKHHLLV